MVILVASTGVVAFERLIIREVIHEWNAVHSFNKKIIPLHVGWETRSSPEMGSSPQAIKNNDKIL